MAKAVGIDFGAEGLRGVLVENARGKLQLLSAGALPLSELSALPDNEDKRLAIAEKLKELVRGAKLKAPLIRVAASGAATELRYILVPPVPPWRLELLVKYEVEERSSDKNARTYDSRILDMPDLGGQYSVLIATFQEQAANALLGSSRDAKLGEVEIDHEAIALYNAYFHGHGVDPDKTVLVADVGADEVTVLLVRNGSLYHARSFLGGGRRFNAALADELKIDPLEADDVKKREGEICFDLAPPTSSSIGRIPRTGRTASLNNTRRMVRNPATEKSDGLELVPSGTPNPPLVEVAPPQEDLALTSHNTLEVPTGVLPMSLEIESQAPAMPPETPAERRRRQISGVLMREAAALCAALENIVQNVRLQTKMREMKVDRVYLCGAGSRLKGLSEFIARRMKSEVEPLHVFRNVDMTRLPAAAAESLKKEQDTLAIAMGIALSGLCKGAFSFLLWPEALKQRKEFRARGAFLYYAAAALLLALVLFWMTPWRTVEVLEKNIATANTAIQQAQARNKELDALMGEKKRLELSKKQIEDNVNSGDFFLGMMDKLRSNRRMPADINLISVSTDVPSVVQADFEQPVSVDPKSPVIKDPSATKNGKATKKEKDHARTFQDQGRVFLRGFARGRPENLIPSIMWTTAAGSVFKAGFGDLLVAHPLGVSVPNHPEPLFKDIRIIWTDSKDHPQGPSFLKEFVLEAYVVSADDKKPKAASVPAPQLKAQPVKGP